MELKQRKEHWENVFQTKDTTKVSWHQVIPATSLRLIDKLNIPKTSKIIEVGAGDSFLGDFLTEKGYSEITLLDISKKALESIKNRLGEKSKQISFEVADITNFTLSKRFNLWHDRAVFHFLTENNDIQKYVKTVSESIVSGGYFIIGTFSDNGPNMCSGLKVQQYSEMKLAETFDSYFQKLECFTENHNTPSGGSQNFLFCIFQRK